MSSFCTKHMHCNCVKERKAFCDFKYFRQHLENELVAETVTSLGQSIAYSFDQMC